MNILVRTLLLVLIIVGCASTVLGLAVLIHVVGPGATLAALLVLFAGGLAYSWKTGGRGGF
jgi:hypothetical protein